MLENGRVLLSDINFETIHLVCGEKFGRGKIVQNGEVVIGEIDNSQRKVLEILASNPGMTLKSSEIIQTIWPSFDISDGIKVLRVRVKELRKRLKDVNPSLSNNIECIYGVGYRWSEVLLEPIDEHTYYPTSVRNNLK